MWLCIKWGCPLFSFSCCFSCCKWWNYPMISKFRTNSIFCHPLAFCLPLFINVIIMLMFTAMSPILIVCITISFIFTPENFIIVINTTTHTHTLHTAALSSLISLLAHYEVGKPKAKIKTKNYGTKVDLALKKKESEEDECKWGETMKRLIHYSWCNMHFMLAEWWASAYNLFSQIALMSWGPWMYFKRAPPHTLHTHCAVCLYIRPRLGFQMDNGNCNHANVFKCWVKWKTHTQPT